MKHNVICQMCGGDRFLDTDKASPYCQSCAATLRGARERQERLLPILANMQTMLARMRELVKPIAVTPVRTSSQWSAHINQIAQLRRDVKFMEEEIAVLIDGWMGEQFAHVSTDRRIKESA